MDYDGNLLFATAKGSFLKTDQDGNYVSGKLADGNNNIFIHDMTMLPDGDKIIRYSSVSGNPVLARLDKDLNTVKWSKQYVYYHYQPFTVQFSNLLIDGNDILLAGGFRPKNSNLDYQSFITKIDAATGDTSVFRYYETENSISFINKIYKTNTGYLANCYLSVTASAGRSGYIRFDEDLNIVRSKRLNGQFNSYNFSFLPHADGSFHVTYGGLWDMTLSLIDGKDSIRWVKDLPGLLSNPSVIMECRDGSIFILGDNNSNLVVGNIPWSTIHLVRVNKYGFAGNCQLETTPSLNSFDLQFTRGNNLLQVSDEDTWKQPTTFTVSALDGAIDVRYNCNQLSVCNSLKLMGNASVCSDDPLSIIARTNEGCKTPVDWSVFPSTGFDMDENNDSAISLSFHQSGVYKIYGSISLPCKEPLMDSIEVHVNLLDKLDLGADATLCDGTSVTLAAGNQFKSWLWQDGSTDATFTAIKPGKYFVRVEDFCGNIYSDTIVLAATATLLPHHDDMEICLQDTLQLSAPPDFIEYVWTSDANDRVVAGPTITDTPGQNTSYFLSVKTTESCYLFDTVNVIVKPIPGIGLGKDTSVCEGETLILNAGGGFNEYMWSTGNTNSFIEVANAGTYTVRVTGNNGCVNSDTINVYSKPVPQFYLGKDTTLCEGVSFDLSVNLPDASYLWNTGSTSNAISVRHPGTYWAKVSQDGCSETDTIHIAFSPAPSVNLGNDTTLCEGQTMVLDASWPGAWYQWNDGFDGPVRQIVKSGTYNVSAHLSSCVSKDTIRITFLSAPEFSFLTDTVICSGETLLLSPKAFGQNVFYTWQDGSTGNEKIIQSPGNYRITASNFCGSAVQNIGVKEVICGIHLPNAFTPNNDGLNDLFRIRYPGQLKEFEMTIYNRWGSVLFRTNDPYTGWDGRYRGELQPNGVYVWTVSFVNKTGASQKLKGTVSLIR